MRISHSCGRSPRGKIAGDQRAALRTAKPHSASSQCGCSSAESPGRITCACREVSFSQLSTLIIASSIGSAASSRPASGADSAGFPAMTISPRTRPSPGVAISSARHEIGAWPSTSGALRTLVCQRPVRTGPRRRAVCAIVAIAGVGNIAPPATSRWPVSTLTTSTAQEARVPNSWLHKPIRPYTTARSVCGEFARQAPDALGRHAAGVGHGLGAERGRGGAAPPRCLAPGRSACPGSTRPSAPSTWTIASRNAASMPGTMGIHSSAFSAVPVRRGSTTMVRPPRSRMRLISPMMSGQENSDPCDACGFAPITRNRSVRCTSGTGMLQGLPKSCAHARFFGHWSTVPADQITGMRGMPATAPV